jgi:hypothetical protein
MASVTEAHKLLKKIEYVFNKIYLNLIKEVKQKNGELKKIIKQHYSVFDKSSSKHIEHLSSEINKSNSAKVFLKPFSNDLLVNQEILDIHLLKDISVKDIVDVVQECEKDVLKSYLYILYMLVHLRTDESKLDTVDKVNECEFLFKTSMRLANSTSTDSIDMQKEVDDIIDDDLRNIIENIYESRKNMTNALLNSSDDVDEDITDHNDIFKSAFDMLNDSKIGELAKEISQDIDVSDLNLDHPEQLLNFDAMLSGKNTALSDIIGKVGTKIAAKIQNGELNQEDLMKEAFGMMSKLNGNNFMEDMMKNMGGGGGMGDMMGAMSGMGAMMKAMNGSDNRDDSDDEAPHEIANTEQSRKSKKQRQLRKKLEARSSLKE